MEPGIHNLSNEDYHAAPGISNSGLSIIAERTPAHYKASRENPRKATEATDDGTRLHAAILEPEEFCRIYVPIEKFDMRTKIGKAGRAEWDAANAGKLPIDPEERDQSLRIQQALYANSQVRELLEGSRRERSIFARDPETGVLVKARPDSDKIITGRRVLSDVKSTKNASPEDFMWSAYRYGYFRQAPFHTDVCNWEGSEQPVDAFFFIAFEKEPPYAYVIYEAAPRFLSRGRDAYRSALNEYARCVEADTWPAYDTSTHTLDLPEAIHKRMDMADSDIIEDISYAS